MWSWPVAVPTWSLGACGLMLVQVDPKSKYMSLTPDYTMADDFTIDDGGAVVMGNIWS